MCTVAAAVAVAEADIFHNTKVSMFNSWGWGWEKCRLCGGIQNNAHIR